MKSSACCITRSKSSALQTAFAMLLLGGAVRSPAQSPPSQAATNSASPSTPQEIVDANSLQAKGKRPFHLRMSFQLFTLEGSPAEQGSAEYWWAGPDHTSLQVTTPSLGTVHDTDASHARDAVAARSLYLIGEMLSAVHSPGADLGPQGSQLVAGPRKLAGVDLECIRLAPQASRYFAQSMSVCADAQGTIRLINAPDSAITRNRPARFGEERTALDITIVLAERKAITGQVEQLQSIAPNDSHVVLDKPSDAAEQKAQTHSDVHLAGGVTAGSKISGPVPEYPMMARQQRITGTVVLLAEITKEGKIDHLWPLASADPLLTTAAMAAVSKWTYRPYLLNGQPTSVTTNITVHFNLNAGGI